MDKDIISVKLWDMMKVGNFTDIKHRFNRIILMNALAHQKEFAKALIDLIFKINNDIKDSYEIEVKLEDNKYGAFTKKLINFKEKRIFPV